MISLDPAQPQAAVGCRRQTRALLQSAVRRTEALPTHRHIHCARPLLPPPTAMVRCSPPSAFDIASRNAPATSRLRPFDCRTPRDSARSLRTQPPDDLLRLGFDDPGP